MAFTRKGRASAAGEKAQQALNEGHAVLVWETPSLEGEQLEEIEALGWQLAQMSAYYQPNGKHPVHVCVFRLAATPTSQG